MGEGEGHEKLRGQDKAMLTGHRHMFEIIRQKRLTPNAFLLISRP